MKEIKNERNKKIEIEKRIKIKWTNDLRWTVPCALIGGIDGLVSSLFGPSYIPATIKKFHDKGIKPGLANFVCEASSIGVYGYQLNTYIQNIVENPTNLESYLPIATNVIVGIGLPIARHYIKKSKNYNTLRETLPPILTK